MDRNYIGYVVLTIAYEYAQYFHNSDGISSVTDNENVNDVEVATCNTETGETNANVSMLKKITKKTLARTLS